jgi:hypothetical protein
MQHFTIDAPSQSDSKNLLLKKNEKISECIETKDILFTGPMNGVNVKIEML